MGQSHYVTSPTKPLHGYNAVTAPHYIRDGGHLLFIVLNYVRVNFISFFKGKEVLVHVMKAYGWGAGGEGRCSFTRA